MPRQTPSLSHGGLYDGFDFDDEVIPTNGQQQLIDVLLAVRKAFPTAIITFDAFIDGADPGVGSGHQGEDIAIVAQAGYCSISHIQRNLNVGYNKAAKLVERMEKEGVVGPASGKAGGRREVFIEAR